jgi:hypothetical protein
MLDYQLILRWTLFTCVGWLFGIPIIIVLALLGEAVGIGGAQTIVGAGMGAGIGLLQSRVIRRLVHNPFWWICSCVIGLGTPFLVTDILNLVGWSLPYSLLAAIGIGGLVVGVWQSLLFSSRITKTGLWIVASVFGWTLAAATSSAADYLARSHSIRGIWGAFAYVGLVAAGGLILGTVTGIGLAWMSRKEAVKSQ